MRIVAKSLRKRTHVGDSKEVKKLKEYNEDCFDLGCSDKKCDNEKGLICLCEKLSSKLSSQAT